MVAAYGACEEGGITMAGGRPPVYKTVEEMQTKIDAYFEECAGRVATDAEGNPLIDKYGEVIIIGQRPLTVTGLALALGFNTRQALINYQAKEEFVDAILRAKTRIEQYAEERLYDKDGANGAKFSLANNFEGWKEKQQIDASVDSKIEINIELTDE